MRRMVAASAILAALLTMPLGLAAATLTPSVLPTDSERATAALEYLLAAQAPDGSIDGSIGETADFVMGAAAAGYDPATLHGCADGTGALGFIATKSDDVVADAAQTGKAILAVVAAGDDPAVFDGRDLPARLNALYHSDTGAFGNGSTFSQSFAILAIVASGGSVPAAAIADLAVLQGTDGSWGYGSAAPAPGEGDTNSTAIALMALHAGGVASADVTALAFLASQQLPDGGFPYQNSSAWGPPASDPDSDSMVLQALLAAGQDPTAEAWSKGSGNVLTNLRASQGLDGGFVYPGMGESAFTTSQVPAALMRVPYGVATHFTAGRTLAASACSSPTPTATPAPTATDTPTPTAAPTPTRKPTVRPTAGPAALPTAAFAETPADTAPPASSPIGTAAPTPSATVVVAAMTAGPSIAPGVGTTSAPAGPSGGLPAPVVYVLAVLAGAVAVSCGGWLVLSRPVAR